jgi:hypothetical protein
MDYSILPYEIQETYLIQLHLNDIMNYIKTNWRTYIYRYDNSFWNRKCIFDTTLPLDIIPFKDPILGYLEIFNGVNYKSFKFIRKVVQQHNNEKLQKLVKCFPDLFEYIYYIVAEENYLDGLKSLDNNPKLNSECIRNAISAGIKLDNPQIISYLLKYFNGVNMIIDIFQRAVGFHSDKIAVYILSIFNIRNHYDMDFRVWYRDMYNYASYKILKILYDYQLEDIQTLKEWAHLSGRNLLFLDDPPEIPFLY